MAEIGKAGSFTRLNQPGFRTAVDSAHRLGHNIFTYMNPMAGVPLPELQRRNGGLGLWRVGLDGTMTWAFVNLKGDWANQPVHYAKVLYTEDGVIDTLHWEGFREGIDDVRYLTTLMATLNDCIGRFPHHELVLESYEWLHPVDIADGDLNAIRREMARRIAALSDLGLGGSPQEILAGIDLTKIQVTTFMEPWEFRHDPADDGTPARWFDPTLDDSQWAPIRTNQLMGSNMQGFPGGRGFGWYRATLPSNEKELAGTFNHLYFDAIDEEAWVYLNGQQVFEHTAASTNLLPEELWITPFVVSLAGVELHGRDPLAVRVYSKEAMAGIYKPVHLIRSTRPLTDEQLHAVRKLEAQE